MKQTINKLRQLARVTAAIKRPRHLGILKGDSVVQAINLTVGDDCGALGLGDAALRLGEALDRPRNARHYWRQVQRRLRHLEAVCYAVAKELEDNND